MIAVLAAVTEKCDFSASDWPQPPGPRALSELHGSIEAIVIRECQRFVFQLTGAQHEFFDVRSTIEERKIGVAVQLGVGHL